MGLRLDAQQLRRARVTAQWLGAARLGVSAADVVAAVVGIQAQDPAAAALSIRARGTGLGADDVQAAIAQTGELVLIWSLRGTRHLHHRGDVRWLLGLLGPPFNRPGRRAVQLGIDGEVGANAVRVVRDALTDGPLPRHNIKQMLAAQGVDPSGQAPVHVLRRAALEGVLCILPDPTGEERYVLLDDWIPPTDSLDRDRAAAELARRYLRAFGPAGPADFAIWSGLSADVVKRAWSSIAGEVVEVDQPRGAGWVLTAALDAVVDVTTAVDRPAPVRLLGAFDTLLLGYADRTDFVPADRLRQVNAGGGMIKPTMLADGRIVATWRHLRYRSRVEVRPFGELSADEEAGVASETAAIGRFLGTEPTLEIVSD